MTHAIAAVANKSPMYEMKQTRPTCLCIRTLINENPTATEHEIGRHLVREVSAEVAKLSIARFRCASWSERSALDPDRPPVLSRFHSHCPTGQGVF